MEFLSAFNFYIGSTIRIILLVIIGLPLLGYLRRLFVSLCSKRFSRHIGLLIGNLIFYGGIIFIGVNVLHEFGFNVTALLGAAGVIGVAIGFASQTSISNIISGFFLLLERPFFVGDIIKSGDVLGAVESIDLLAVRVQTFDNKLIRVPNEMVLKQALVNLTFYPIKRVDMVLSTAYADNVEETKKIIADAVMQHGLFLRDPQPVIKMNKIAQPDFCNETRLYIAIRVWVAKEDFFNAGSVLVELLKKEFDAKEITITIAQIN